MLEPTQSSIDLIRCITWSKIKFLSSDSYTIFLALPKTSEEEEGVIIDLFAYEDSRYCPMFNLNKLLKLCEKIDRNKDNDMLFRFESGVLLTMSKMNILLKKLKELHFPDKQYHWTCHSFRSGLPSYMASKPDLFTEEDIKGTCWWRGISFKRYTRTKGIAQRSIMKRVHDSLLNKK